MDSGGNAVSGSTIMTFSLYAQPSGGTALWLQPHSVAVDDGLFNAYLDVDPASFDGRDLWLGLQVAGSFTISLGGGVKLLETHSRKLTSSKSSWRFTQ